MMMSSNGNIFGQWRRALMLSLICTRCKGWVNNREAGYLRRHRPHYGVIVILLVILFWMKDYFKMKISKRWFKIFRNTAVLGRSTELRGTPHIIMLLSLIQSILKQYCSEQHQVHVSLITCNWIRYIICMWESQRMNQCTTVGHGKFIMHSRDYVYTYALFWSDTDRFARIHQGNIIDTGTNILLQQYQ